MDSGRSDFSFGLSCDSSTSETPWTPIGCVWIISYNGSKVSAPIWCVYLLSHTCGELLFMVVDSDVSRTLSLSSRDRVTLLSNNSGPFWTISHLGGSLQRCGHMSYDDHTMLVPLDLGNDWRYGHSDCRFGFPV